VCNCCWLVCGGGICFFIDGNAILDGPEFARGGDILGGRETGENLEYFLPFSNTTGAKSRNRTLNIHLHFSWQGLD